MKQNLPLRYGIGLLAILFFLQTTSLYATSRIDLLDIPTFLEIHHIETVQDYARWLKDHMVYIIDRDGDHWATPQETIQKGGGDCEDLAFLSAAVLKALGFRARVLAHGDFRNGHVYCIFPYQGTYYVFENNHLASTQQYSVKDIAIYLGQHHHSDYLAELTLYPKEVKFLYMIKHI